MSHKTLFLQQSYEDCTRQYMELLEKQKMPLWDYVILTASNESQAQSYRMQIQYRLDHGMLPKSIHYAVLSDPDGKRVGSGGATLNVLRYIHQDAGSFDDKRILVIHSGGDSKRVPQYSACGKLFSPVPRLLPNGRRSTLFDEFMISMCGVAARIRAGMLVCSGDVLLLFNPLQIDFYGSGAAALSIKEPAEIGKNHGVYRVDEQGNVGGFLHKKTVDQLHELQAADENGNVDIDTGAVIMDTDLLKALYKLVDTPEQFDAYVNENTRLSFYADFLYPLASQSSLEQYYKETPEGDFTPELHECRTKLWEVLHPFHMKLIRMSPAAFIHFGTTKELRHLMTEGMEQFVYLGWNSFVNTNSTSIRSGYASGNSYISKRAKIGKGTYIEDSYVHHGTVIGTNCVVSGVTLDGQNIPDGAVIHGLKLGEEQFVARMYGVNDNPKECSLFGRKLSEPLWTAKIYPICRTMREAVDAALQAYEQGFPIKDSFVSLKDSFNMADVTAILPWQDKLDDKVRVESLLEAIDNKVDLKQAFISCGGNVSPRVERLLLREAERLDSRNLEQFSRKIRIYYMLSLVKETYMDNCFDTIGKAVLDTAVAGLECSRKTKLLKEESIVRLPVRVNWGGGWSDTPPYCMEHGGTVLNAAVLLDGNYPIEAIARRIEGNRIVLASADSGAEQEFTDIKQLQDSSNPYDPFALHKAALIACGLIPYSENRSIEEITNQLGSGLYLSTRVINIPRGSGLGTSSILAGACVKALYEITGRKLEEDELYNRVLCMEQIMSTGGGWQDQVGGLAPGIKMVTSHAEVRQQISCMPCVVSEKTMKELDERFCLIYSGQRRLARNLLRDVVGRYVGGNPDAVEVLYEIQRSAVLMRFELEKGDVDAFARLLNEHWELSKRLDSGCTNVCIDMIFKAVEDLIDAKMICGAGGGGFLQVVLKKGITAKQLQERLHDVFQDSGVSVWQCQFV